MHGAGSHADQGESCSVATLVWLFRFFYIVGAYCRGVPYSSHECPWGYSLPFVSAVEELILELGRLLLSIFTK